MVDLVTAVAAGVIGVGVGGAISYLVFYARPRPQKITVMSRDPAGNLSSTSVTATELERSRKEMRTIMVERDLLSSAMMKLYEAESEGRITTEEREMISKRYSAQIKDMQSKLKDVELMVEVGELEKLRGELVSMFQEKIGNIETRLNQARERLNIAPPPEVKKEPAPRVEKPDELERVVERRARTEMSEGDRRVKEIRDEVMEALTRLEQIDVEKKQQEN